MSRFSWRKCAVLTVVILISFLSFSSQVLFQSIEPGPLKYGESLIFNCLVASLLICYIRSCLTNPGVVPATLKPDGFDLIDQIPASTGRFCSKCKNVKPPRAHHCRVCSRCVPKMDHHCMWMDNCVSHRTFAHFIRFLFYALAAMAYLESLIFVRLRILWDIRRVPSHLGPSVTKLVHLLLLSAINSITFFAVFIIFCKTVWSLLYNVTTIEEWEIERHRALVRRSRRTGGQVYGPNGIVIAIEKQEFPYDIGIWKNLSQGMGTQNIISWFNPLDFSMNINSGTKFEVNGIDVPQKPWPPPDPDRMATFTRAQTINTPDFSKTFDREAFRRRQAADLSRRGITMDNHEENKQLKSHAPTPSKHDGIRGNVSQTLSDNSAPEAGSERWTNEEGERLVDFGVDEETELHYIDKSL